MRSAWRAGVMPTNTPVPMASRMVNRRTRPSSGTSRETAARLKPPTPANLGTYAAITLMKARDSRIAIAAPPSDSSRLSVSICRATRPRLAPSARRTPISPRRATPRAMRMPARFAAAISTTISGTSISAAARRSGTTLPAGSKGSRPSIDRSKTIVPRSRRRPWRVANSVSGISCSAACRTARIAASLAPGNGRVTSVARVQLSMYLATAVS